MFVSTFLSIALAVAPVHVHSLLGSPKQAAKQAKKAEKLWRDGLYDEASTLLGEAYELDPRPGYLYARASVEKDAGRCEEAVEYFEAFIDTEPPSKDAEAARRAMKPCQDELEAEAAEAARLEREREEQERLEREREEERDEEERRRLEEQHERQDRPVRKDVLGGALMGVGAGVTAAGIGTLVAGITIHGAGEDADTADAFVDERQRGRTLTGVGIGLLGAGVAFMIAGGIRYGVLASKQESATARLPPARTRFTGSGVSVRF